MVAKKKRAAKKAAPKSKVVSGMPDGSEVPRPNTRDDLEAAFQFTKKQKRRSSK